MGLYGRRKIYAESEVVTAENIIYVLNSALSDHFKNMMEESYLYRYSRGIQPVLERSKDVRPEINNKIVENHAAEAVAFKNGYFLTEPICYKSRKESKGAASKVNKANEYLYLSGKHYADNEIVDWFHRVGIGVLYIEATDNPETPVREYSIDPRQAFVCYSRMPGNRPLIGVNMVTISLPDGNSKVIYDVFTEDKIFHLSSTPVSINIHDDYSYAIAANLDSEGINSLGGIPIIEYTYNSDRMSAFESVIPLYDAINDIQSNRQDGIQQFIQSLMVFYNCELGDDADGNAITPAYIREAGAIFLKSIGQDKADLKILSEQLDQTQTQVLVEDLLEQAYTISGVPFSVKTTQGTSDNLGAVYLRNGWATADTFARNTDDLWRKSSKYHDEIFFRILKYKTNIELSPTDVTLQIIRNQLDNLLVKTQGALNMKQLGFSPEITFARTGLSSDPVGDVANSQKYIDALWTNTDTVVDESENGENPTANSNWVKGYYRSPRDTGADNIRQPYQKKSKTDSSAESEESENA